MITSCRSCGGALERTFLDLGKTPLANSYLDDAQLALPEPSLDLHAKVCDDCKLVQLDHTVDPSEIFSDYAYFSSYSDAWVEHARQFTAKMVERLALDQDSLVIEVASNDGYLLRHLVERGIPVLGIEPAANVAAVAVAAGVPTEVRFFGVDTAEWLVDQGKAADLIVGNNVFAHVPDINDFVGGLKLALKPGGVISIEVPHLLRLIEGVQFDTIYHEHFSYFSLLAAERAFSNHGLRIFDVEELPTHGGSLRLLGCHRDDPRADEAGVERVRAAERAAGLDRIETYAGFALRVEACRRALNAFLDHAHAARHRVVGYGAAAKGNTLLNYCGVGPDRVSFVVDRSPHKQGRYLPGSRIPIDKPDRVFAEQPDYVLILPWNLTDEIVSQMSGIRAWGGKFVVPVPEAVVIP